MNDNNLVGMPNQIKMLHEFVFVVELLKKIKK